MDGRSVRSRGGGEAAGASADASLNRGSERACVAEVVAQIDLLPVDLFPGDRRISPLGLHPYVLFNATRKSANYTRTELVRALEALMHCNRRLVSSSLDDTLVLQKTLISIVAKPV